MEPASRQVTLSPLTEALEKCYLKFTADRLVEENNDENKDQKLI